MKWIVVVLVLLNLSAWLLGKRFDPDAQQSVSADQIETINAAAMSVIPPEQELAMRKVNDAVALQEETLAQLKVDQRGKVLMAPTASSDTPEVAGKSQPVNKPIVQASTPPVIVAHDRSEPVQKPITLAKIAVPKPDTEPQASAEAALKCYRLGPFTSQNSLASVRRALEKSGIKYAVDERGAAKKIKAVRVYMGAYASTAALQADVKRLKAMNVDHFVIRLNDTPLVQLGYFAEPARAKAYQKTLKARGIDAKADTIYHQAKINSWLDVQPASKDRIKALGLPANTGAKEQACR